MSKQYIFIDDSGDPGLVKSNTTRFVVAAVLVVDRQNLDYLTAAIDGFRAGLRWSNLDEFKFSSTRKSVIKDLLQFIRQFKFESYAVVIDKAKITGAPHLPENETLYDYAMKELLLKLELSEPTIVIDGAIGKKHAEKTRTYLRQALKRHGVGKSKISFTDSRRDTMVQLADIVAGSVARSLDAKKSDHADYVKLLKIKKKNIYEITP
ncbi:DUF3800 domain-containing protein [Candidatus Saccharibacteria bacterium]|nr:DUF3800 domain-containing protein [Candidatus Saccharibacteria bacterium]